MNAHVEIDAGVCGFRTQAAIHSEDGQNISLEITSDCEKITMLAEAIASLGAVDAYEEISLDNDSRILACGRETLKGCCSGCAVPIGLFKAMQITAGLSLPKDVTVELSKE